MEMFKLVTAILAANLFTAMFVYGMVQANKVRDEDTMPLWMCGLIGVPLLFVVGGVWIYW